jgi:hypothetical protein
MFPLLVHEGQEKMLGTIILPLYREHMQVLNRNPDCVEVGGAYILRRVARPPRAILIIITCTCGPISKQELKAECES